MQLNGGMLFVYYRIIEANCQLSIQLLPLDKIQYNFHMQHFMAKNIFCRIIIQNIHLDETYQCIINPNSLGFDNIIPQSFSKVGKEVEYDEIVPCDFQATFKTSHCIRHQQYYVCVHFSGEIFRKHNECMLFRVKSDEIPASTSAILFYRPKLSRNYNNNIVSGKQKFLHFNFQIFFLVEKIVFEGS